MADKKANVSVIITGVYVYQKMFGKTIFAPEVFNNFKDAQRRMINDFYSLMRECNHLDAFVKAYGDISRVDEHGEIMLSKIIEAFVCNDTEHNYHIDDNSFWIDGFEDNCTGDYNSAYMGAIHEIHLSV